MVDRLRGFCLAAGLILLLGGAGLFLIRYRVYAVPTSSMTPALLPGDRIIVDTWSRDAAPGDVVLALVTGESERVVKRVTATAGTTVTCCDTSGRLLVGNVTLPGSARPGDNPFSVRVTEGHLFLTGDNPVVSRDSRSAASTGPTDGTVPSSAVLGRVAGVVFPAARAHVLPDRAAPTLRAVLLSLTAGLALTVAAALLSLALAAHRRVRRSVSI
ncbi:signal peptidase I [Actinoplanes lutulentus]|uniref:Signal peptidase I n=1 Tax=Actinoplanes lutulentus TaxID=1287878 RepID=A0A327ZLG6_9ACTN|nr:signal peptidase I [Actinoplanes lutulentus]MBB2940856.1 signal peptidase I [Actinoplanes lutulentus]RAK43165.1 signal peptidase I [Actinoplanes lutulentus]